MSYIVVLDEMLDELIHQICSTILNLERNYGLDDKNIELAIQCIANDVRNCDISFNPRYPIFKPEEFRIILNTFDDVDNKLSELYMAKIDEMFDKLCDKIYTMCRYFRSRYKINDKDIRMFIASILIHINKKDKYGARSIEKTFNMFRLKKIIYSNIILSDAICMDDIYHNIDEREPLVNECPMCYSNIDDRNNMNLYACNHKFCTICTEILKHTQWVKTCSICGGSKLINNNKDDMQYVDLQRNYRRTFEQILNDRGFQKRIPKNSDTPIMDLINRICGY